MCVCFLQRLQAKVLKLVDISYGGENGFNQAIELSAEVLSNVKFIQEKKLIGGLSCGRNGTTTFSCDWYQLNKIKTFAGVHSFLIIVSFYRAVL